MMKLGSMCSHQSSHVGPAGQLRKLCGNNLAVTNLLRKFKVVLHLSGQVIRSCTNRCVANERACVEPMDIVAISAEELHPS